MTKLTWPQAAVLISLTFVGGALVYLGKSEQAVALILGAGGGWLLPSPKQ